jgi:hypothetical protein
VSSSCWGIPDVVLVVKPFPLCALVLSLVPCWSPRPLCCRGFRLGRAGLADDAAGENSFMVGRSSPKERARFRAHALLWPPTRSCKWEMHEGKMERRRVGRNSRTPPLRIQIRNLVVIVHAVSPPSCFVTRTRRGGDTGSCRQTGTLKQRCCSKRRRRPCRRLLVLLHQQGA